MKVIVISATGTIGKAIVRAIVNRHEVIPLGFIRSAVRVDISDREPG